MADDEREFLRSIFLMEAWDVVGSIEDELQKLHAAARPRMPRKHPLLILTHTVRGTAAVQGFVGIADIAAAMEARLEGVIGGGARVIRAQLPELEASLAAIKAALDAIGIDAAQDPPSDPPPFTTTPVRAAFLSVDDTCAALDQFFAESSEILEYFGAEATEHLEVMTRCVLRLEQGQGSEDEVATLFRAVHTLKGAAYTVGCRPVGDVAHVIEDLMTEVRDGRIVLTGNAIDALLCGTDALKLLLSNRPEHRSQLAATLPRAIEMLERVLGGVAASAPALLPALPSTPAAVPPLTADPGARAASIRVGLDRLDALMNGVGELVIARSRLDRRLGDLDRVGDLLVSSRARMARAVGDFEGKYEYNPLTRAAHTDTIAGSFAELEFDRYDDFNILARGLAEISADVSEVRGQLSAVIRAVRDDAAQIRRLTADLRGEITRARMVPIGNLFSRFGRQVRDTAQAAGRAVGLAVSGETVELDNAIIEQIADPLLHLVQNAIWHGIEDAATRQARDKPAQGTVSVSARQQGGSVYVEVEDDGGGIDVAQVKAQAVARGFVPAAAVETMTDAEALQLIFRPGFSTATTVTTGAGRGVGMDVVRTNVRRLNGEIEIATELQAGTRFTLKLPLTVAISDALLVRVGPETLAVPLTAVRRIVVLQPAQIERVDRTEVVEVEGERLDLVRLEQHLLLPARRSHRPVPVLVLRAGGQSIAVSVDEILRKEEVVIKSLGEFLDGVGPYTGTTIGGDGRVVLVLDPSRLLEGRSAAVGTRARRARSKPRRVQAVVLLVDDSVSVRKFVGGMLERAGFTVHTAIDGAEALERLTDLVVDVVVTDLEMPRINGYELIETLRLRPATRELPVIVLTTRVSEKHVQAAERLGVRHVVSKPVDERMLVELVTALAPSQ